ncbi:hypothetical protein AB0I81_22665 [Nonomuraea sp. NPDC050404]|uniref:hypothetical protein n=1 Tax=Nonomuraea sp. NPDC050404 TaxID=3155783 RepID=UPI0033DEBD63
MPEQVHETCEPIRPEDLPDDLVELFSRSYLDADPRCGAVRAGLAALLTEVCERIAQAVEARCIDPDWPSDEVSVNGELAAAVIRSWPEDLNA